MPRTTSMPIAIRVDQEEDGYRARLGGELDLTAEPRARKALFDLLESRPEQLTIDLTDVSFIDSSGLRVLLACRNRCQEVRTRLRLAGVGPEIARTLQVANLRNFFDCEPKASS